MRNPSVKQDLRRELRSRRETVPQEERERRARALSEALAPLIPARGLAAYAPLPGEPDVRPFLQRSVRAGVPVWLPVTTPGAPLEWARWDAEELDLTAPGKGPWGIPEPDGHRLSSREILHIVDAVLVPALAIAEDGLRLGQGGGFYDRSFGPEGLSPMPDPVPDGGALPCGSPGHPILIGIVHDEEVLPAGSFSVQPHDLRLHAIASPAGATRVSREL